MRYKKDENVTEKHYYKSINSGNFCATQIFSRRDHQLLGNEILKNYNKIRILSSITQMLANIPRTWHFSFFLKNKTIYFAFYGKFDTIQRSRNCAMYQIFKHFANDEATKNISSVHERFRVELWMEKLLF